MKNLSEKHKTGNIKFELSTLYEISNILSSSIDLSATLRGVLRVLAYYLEMNRGNIALKMDNEIKIIAAYGMSREEAKKGVYRLGEGIVGKVVKNGLPIVIPDIREEPEFLNKTGSRRLDDDKKIAFISVPIKFKHNVLGALSVDRMVNKRQISFEKDLRLLKIVSALIAQTVQQKMEFEKEKKALEEERDELKHQLKSRYSVKNIISVSDAMQVVFECIHKVAPTKANVLLLGESGTGKELVAKAMHFMSARANKPFIKFNCASIPEGLLESELFGHEKGAFTGATSARKGRFELANGGTLFLDEIGDLPLALQPKLLRAIQEREFERVGGEKTIKVDVRLIAATSRNLEELMAQGKFREDLYYRLNVLPIMLPPLRERKNDIPVLVEHFLNKFNQENNKNVFVSKDALGFLTSYDWPGNVRELENCMERMVIMAKGDTITADDLPLIIKHSVKNVPKSREYGYRLSLKDNIIHLEKESIINALNKSGWVISRAARLLGITQRQLGYKMMKYNIYVEKNNK